MCAFLPLLLGSSKPLVFTLEQAQGSWSTHRSSNGNKIDNSTWAGCEMLSVQWFQSASAILSDWPLPAASHAVVVQNELIPAPTARNPFLASSCHMEVTAKGQIFLCYQHALIDLFPHKAQNSSSTSALRPQAGLGPGANKTLKAHNWHHSAQYSLSLYSPSWLLTFANG